ncbi:hypothetical protein E4U57_007280 [Claviceps arundinis]|uniref:Uncharacterized protein n=1 Tax=Claviceps arundinis TaxID=1623583 RepID=A0ABQ7PFJ6_9HYPO|nr:hypothetical protein E4U57_007280 [Claviceps arundinis]
MKFSAILGSLAIYGLQVHAIPTDLGPQAFQSIEASSPNSNTLEARDTYCCVGFRCGIWSKPTNRGPETDDNDDNVAGGIITLLQSLVARLDRLEQTGGRIRSLDREITPDESVFGGKAFRPTGYAALPEWDIQIADKCRRDDQTFKVERDRIVMIVSYLNETPAKLFNSRYISAESPFRSAAEVIATPTGLYQDGNQASRAGRPSKHLPGSTFAPFT